MKKFYTIFVLAVSLICATNGWSAPLEITRDYTSSADLNDALTAGGFDAISSSGTYTLALTGPAAAGGAGVPINASCTVIDVTGGKLTLAPTGPTGGGAAACLFTGTVNVATGAELYLGVQDALGTKDGQNVTLNIRGTLSLFDGKNQTLRGKELNLYDGAQVTGGQIDYRLNSFAIRALEGSSTITSKVNMRGDASNAYFEVAENAVLTMNGVISQETGTMSFRKTGAGTLVLGGSNSYKGTTKLEAGTIRLGKTNAIATGSTGLVMTGTSTFDLNGYNQQLKSVSGNNGSIVNSRAGTQQSTLTLDVSDSLAFSGAIGNGVDIVKTGAGTWTIDTTANWGANSLTVAEGTVIKTGGSSPRFLTGDITIADGAKMLWNTRDAVGASSGTTGARNVNIFGELELFSAQTSRYSNYNLYGGTILGKYSTTLDDCGRIMLMPDGPTTLTAKAVNPDGSAITRSSVYDGILAIRDTTNGTIAVEDSAASVDLLWKNAQYLEGNDLTGKTAKLTKTGAGVLKIQDGNLQNTLGLNIDAGRLVLDNTRVTASTVTIADGASVFGTNGSVISGTLALNGDYVVQLADVAGTPMSVGNVTFGPNAGLELDATGVNIADFNAIPVFNVTEADNQQAVYEQLAKLFAQSDFAKVMDLNLTNGALVLNVDRNAVPEPAAWLLLALGLGWVLKKRFWGTKS